MVIDPAAVRAVLIAGDWYKVLPGSFKSDDDWFRFSHGKHGGDIIGPLESITAIVIDTEVR